MAHEPASWRVTFPLRNHVLAMPFPSACSLYRLLKRCGNDFFDCVADSLKKDVIVSWEQCLKFSASNNRISVEPLSDCVIATALSHPRGTTSEKLRSFCVRKWITLIITKWRKS